MNDLSVDVDYGRVRTNPIGRNRRNTAKDIILNQWMTAGGKTGDFGQDIKKLLFIIKLLTQNKYAIRLFDGPVKEIFMR